MLAHKGPDQAAAFKTWIRARFYFVLEVRIDRFRRHVSTVAGFIEFPAVIHTSDAITFIATQAERRAAMRTGILDQTDLAVFEAIGHQILTEQANAHGRGCIEPKFAGGSYRNPIKAHEFTHGCAGPYLAEYRVVFFAEHTAFPPRKLSSLLYTEVRCRQRAQTHLSDHKADVADKGDKFLP